MRYLNSDPPGIGGVASALEFLPLEFVVTEPIPAIVIERVGAECGTGTARIRVNDDGDLEFAAPGEDYGAAVAVANNSAARLASDTVTKYVDIYRDSAYSAELIGTMTFDLVTGFNNAVALENGEAGDVHYGCFWLHNNGGADITSITVTAGAPLEVAEGDGESIPDSETAPTGPAFAGSANIGTLEPGETAQVWIKRSIDGGASASPIETSTVTVEYTEGGETYSEPLTGHFRVADPAIEGYELYIGVDAMPDFTAAPQAFSAALPFSEALTPDAVNYFAVRYRNRYDLASFNVLSQRIVLDNAGNDITAMLTPPEVVSAVSGPGGEVVLRLRYNPTADAMPADYWRVYVTDDGVDPDPGTDTPQDTGIRPIGLARPEAEVTLRLGPYPYGAEVKILPRVYLLDLDIESQNTAITTVTITTQAPHGGHQLDVTMGGFRGIGSVQTEILTGALRTLVGEAVIDGAFRARLDAFILGVELHNVAHSASGSNAPVEVVSPDEIYINVSGVRRVKIDLLNNRIEANQFAGAEPVVMAALGPVHTTATATYIQVRNERTGKWSPGLVVDNTGKLTFTSEAVQT